MKIKTLVIEKLRDLKFQNYVSPLT